MEKERCIYIIDIFRTVNMLDDILLFGYYCAILWCVKMMEYITA